MTNDIPAFPTDSEGQVGPSTYHYEGMSLRDYFAAKALEGYWAFAGPDRLLQGFEVTAGQCYTMADAMLAERNK